MRDNQLHAQMARHLKELRKCRNLTQKQVEENLELSAGTLSRIENGSRIPEWLEIVRLADTYHVSIQSMLDACGKPSPFFRIPSDEVPFLVAESEKTYGVDIPQAADKTSLGQILLSDSENSIKCMISYHILPPDQHTLYHMVESRIITPGQAADGLSCSLCQLRNEMYHWGFHFPES